MTDRIDHFLYGKPARLKRLRAALPEGLEALSVAGGLVLRETLGDAWDGDAAIARIATLAQAQGVEYDGHVRAVRDPIENDGPVQGLDLLRLTFPDRTGINAGHGFSFRLPDRRFGHAIHLASDRQGYLLLDVSRLITNHPASPDELRDAPRRYRQPILVWHTPFVAFPLRYAATIARLPCDVVFRNSIGWPDPDDVTALARRLGISDPDTPEGWYALLSAMSDACERLPGIEGCVVWTARVSRTGTLKVIEDYEVMQAADMIRPPMPWQPATMDEVIVALAGGPDRIALRDRVL